LTNRSLSQSHERIENQDPTQAPQEPWRFSPSFLDPDFFAFPTFANQPLGYYAPTLGYYAPTLGWTNTLSEDGVHTGSIGDIHGFPPQTTQLRQSCHSKPYTPYQYCIEHPLFYQPLGFEPLDTPGGESPTDDSCIGANMHYDSLSMTSPCPSKMAIPLPTSEM
jgi:hypothetical protein